VLSGVLASCYLAGLPWLIGWAAFSHPELATSELRPLSQVLVWAAAYATVFYAYRLLGGGRLARGSHLLLWAHLSAIGVLVLARQPVLAGGVSLLLLPQLMLQPELLSVSDGVWYLRRVQIFTMLATMVTAVAMVA
jgi:hypothetical protein